MNFSYIPKYRKGRCETKCLGSFWVKAYLAPIYQQGIGLIGAVELQRQWLA